MACKSHNPPRVDKLGRMLECEGLVAFGKRAYNQTSIVKDINN